MRLTRWAVALGLLTAVAAIAAPPGTPFAPSAALKETLRFDAATRRWTVDT